MLMHKTIYDALIDKYGEADVHDFMVHYGIGIDVAKYDTSYLNSNWWGQWHCDSRKRDVKMAWQYFTDLAQPLREASRAYHQKYSHLYDYWREEKELVANLPRLEAKLTKPLDEYATKQVYDYPNHGWTRIYKHAGAENVRLTRIKLAKTRAKIESILAVSDVPPSPNPEIDAAWDYYLNIRALNAPKNKRKFSTQKRKPAVAEIESVTTPAEFLAKLKAFPKTAVRKNRKRQHFVDFEGFIINTQALYDLLRVTKDDPKLVIEKTPEGIKLEHYGHVWGALTADLKVYATSHLVGVDRRTENKISLV